MAKRKLSDLETMISEKANDNVQERIKAFKAAIEKALNDLFGNTSRGIDTFGNFTYSERHPKDCPIEYAKLTALRLAIHDHEPKEEHTHIKRFLPWPAELWETEVDTLRNELLSKMDLLQQMLCRKSKQRPDDVPRADKTV